MEKIQIPLMYNPEKFPVLETITREEHDKLQEKRSEFELLKTNVDQYLGRKEEPKKSIIQEIKRESDKGRERKSKFRTKDMEQ